jgi:molybdopterin/thiamine biosynthesis adenylyltransferase
MDDRIVIEAGEGRYDRLRLIPWWDQDRLSEARVMVVGAGALGNETIKTLALLGIGYLYVIDLDVVERSNLTRSVLFREEDDGRPKAHVAAEAAMRLNPDIRAHPVHGDVSHDVGLGVFRAMDVVIGGLDNREARVAINQACRLVGVPWIDGAIEALSGVARVFAPDRGPCYECTMTEVDYALLARRKSCALLSRDEIAEGKVPTTPTMASIIAGIQVQEALKILHGRDELPPMWGGGYVFNSHTYDCYVVEYQYRHGCPAHESLGGVEEVAISGTDTTFGNLLDMARDRLGPDGVVDLVREIVTALVCNPCGTRTPVLTTLGKMRERDARCGRCGEVRVPEMTHCIDGSEDFLDRTLAEGGIPPLDIVTLRSGDRTIHVELSGDRERALGSAP